MKEFKLPNQWYIKPTAEQFKTVIDLAAKKVEILS